MVGARLVWVGCLHVLLQELLVEHTRRVLKAAQAVDPARLMRASRVVPVVYRGVEVLVKVNSLLVQVELTLSAKVKERAVVDSSWTLSHSRLSCSTRIMIASLLR